MLRRLSDEIRKAQERAGEMAERAKSARTDGERSYFLSRERSWLKLAESYAFTERLTNFSRELERRITPAASTPINQIQLYRPPCSKCGTLTGLIRVEPANEAGHDLRTFRCEVCGHFETVHSKVR